MCFKSTPTGRDYSFGYTFGYTFEYIFDYTFEYIFDYTFDYAIDYTFDYIVTHSVFITNRVPPQNLENCRTSFLPTQYPWDPKFPNCRAHGAPIDFSRIAARFPNSRQSSGESKHSVQWKDFFCIFFLKCS